MTSPIIPWMGGKRRLAAHLISLFPTHKCYVEVFAAGGATKAPWSPPCQAFTLVQPLPDQLAPRPEPAQGA